MKKLMMKWLESITNSKQQPSSWTLNDMLDTMALVFLENGNASTGGAAGTTGTGTCCASLRRVFLGLFFGVPIFMQMRALIFLSYLVVGDIATLESDLSSSSSPSSTSWLSSWSWSWWNPFMSYTCTTTSTLCWKFMWFQLIILFPIHFHIYPSSYLARTKEGKMGTSSSSPTTSILHYHYYILAGPILLIKKASTTMMDCRIQSWICLYVMAFLSTTSRIERDGLYVPILLAGPFFLALGSFLILSLSDDGQNGDLWSDVIRKALRRALLEVLSSIEEDVTEDEMLRLAMLRWIVDYWASSKPSSNENNNQNAASTRRTQNASDGNDESVDNTPKAFVVLDPNQIENSSKEKDSVIDGEGSNNENPSSTQSQDDGIGWHDLSTMLDMTTEQMYKEVRPPTNENVSSHKTHHSNRRQQNNSVRNLRFMISSFDVDESAKPAVLLYKNAVDRFPPSPNLSIAFALASRCPAVLSVVYLHLIGSVHAMNCTLTLLLMMIYEVMRVIDWMRRCQDYVMMERSKLPSQMSPMDDGSKGKHFVPQPFREMQSMEILLIDSTSLLRVWKNVDSSVKALESGLMVMRCVNTIHVATDLAFNVASLATFAAEEVGNHGWLHGIQVLGSDLLHFHMKHKCSDSSERNSARYSNASVDLVKKSHHLTRNVGALIDESKSETYFFSYFQHAVIHLFTGEGRKKSVDESSNPPKNGNLGGSEFELHDVDCLVLEETTSLSEACRGNETQIETITVPSTREDDICSRGTLLSDLELNLNKNKCPRQTRLNDETGPQARLNDETERPQNDASDDDSWTAIPQDEEKLELRVNYEECLSSSTVVKEMVKGKEQSHSNQSADNVGINWLGTGLAILGAVAGSILLASTNDDKANNHEGHGGKRTSTVESIEILDDAKK